MVSEKQLKELSIGSWLNLAKDFEGADLLLGNGFSINLHGHFNYASLFQEFLKKRTPNEREIFKSFATHNFELIQETLLSAKKVNKIFDIAKNDRKIDGAIKALKDGLIESIRNNHPTYSQTNKNQLQQLSIQLNNFGDIFTLNYDLFLYHIIMLIKDESQKRNEEASYSDYFWGKYNDQPEQFKQFMDYDEYLRNHVYYLHGALFLFKIPPDTLKLRRGGAPKELIEMIGEVITRGIMPLFVSEGKYKEKLEAIKRSNYLSFCYGALEESKDPLVIFGTSLSGQDAHIAEAINHQKSKRKLAISMHIANKSKGELKEEIKRLKAKFKSHEICFFDSKTIFKF
jgi:hydroxymethylpyrimidine pyrophosphatase-like HAD family hydrolase